MRRYLPSILVGAALLVLIMATVLAPRHQGSLAAHEPSTAQWTAVEGTGFAARLPGTPQHLQGAAADGEPVERYTVASPSDAVSIGSGGLPATVPRRLDAVVARLAQSSGLPIADEHAATLSGVPARSYRLSGSTHNADTTIFGTVAFSGDRFVTVTYVAHQRGLMQAPQVYADVLSRVRLTR